MKFKLVKYENWIARIIQDEEARHERAQITKKSFKRKIDVLVEESTDEQRTAGDVILKNLIETLDRFGVERTAAQVNFHRNFVCASLQHIYSATEWAKYRTRILNDLGFSEARTEILVVWYVIAYACVIVQKLTVSPI